MSSGCWETDIADAVQAELNATARSWYGKFNATRDWSVVFGPTVDLTALRVNVTPATELEQERHSRVQHQFDYTVPIDFAQKIPATNGVVDKTTCDAVSLLVQNIHDFYNDGHFLATLSTALVLQARRPAIFDEERLYDQNMWLSTINLRVRVLR